MIVVHYRWKIKPGKKEQFIENWSVITRHYLENCGSYGSRLHKGSDGNFHGYAQWPDTATRESAYTDVRVELAREHMRDAIEEWFPDVHFEVVADHLVHPTASAE